MCDHLKQVFRQNGHCMSELKSIRCGCNQFVNGNKRLPIIVSKMLSNTRQTNTSSTNSWEFILLLAWPTMCSDWLELPVFASFKRRFGSWSAWFVLETIQARLLITSFALAKRTPLMENSCDLPWSADYLATFLRSPTSVAATVRCLLAFLWAKDTGETHLFTCKFLPSFPSFFF